MALGYFEISSSEKHGSAIGRSALGLSAEPHLDRVVPSGLRELLGSAAPGMGISLRLPARGDAVR